MKGYSLADQYKLLSLLGDFYCPYQTCNSRRKSQHEAYAHIRSHHDPGLPHMPARAATYYTLKNSRGDVIDFSGIEKTVSIV